jgi:hypothetical protein
VVQQIAMGGTHAAADFRRPFQGLLSSGTIHLEFRSATLQALIPAHPSGAIAFPPSGPEMSSLEYGTR